MADKEFDFEKLEKIWKEMAKETFVVFAKENLGYDPERGGPPDCVGTGDNHDFCWLCPYVDDC